MGYFTGLGKTPMESAKMADMYEALTLLSTENALSE